MASPRYAAVVKRSEQMQSERIADCLARDPAVVAGYVFGSQARAAPCSPRDLDVAVLCTSRLPLPALLDLRADLCRAMDTDRLDLVDLRSAGPVLQRNILAADRRIYCRDARSANAFELLALSRYRDSAYRRRVQAALLRSEYGSR